MWLNVPRKKPPDFDLAVMGLCSGVGMLELAVELALEQYGYRAFSVVHCERDSVAAALLVGIKASLGCEALVWDDLITFDGKPWRGKIHCLCAGMPCPSFSAAGKRGGNDDHRAFGIDGNGPQAHTLRIIGECRPSLVFLENVPQWVTGGHFERFGRGLCEMGYTIQDPVFATAASVGAAHKRERVFIIANRGGSGVAGDGGRKGRGADRDKEGREGPGDIAPGVLGDVLGDGTGVGQREPDHPAGPEPRRDARGCSGGAGNPFRGVGIFAPARNDYRSWAVALGLDPSLAPAIEPPFPMVANGDAFSHADLLRCGGNSVVPLAGAAAFVALLDRLWNP